VEWLEALIGAYCAGPALVGTITQRKAGVVADRRTSFADDYRQHVLPLLAGTSYVAAARLAMDGAEFRDCLALVWAEAMRLGAGFLQDDAMRDVRDWIMAKLVRDLVAIEAGVSEIEAQAWLDPVGHYDGLSDDPALRWTFAAISPEYRAALTERTRQRKSAPG
jgi:hypothetical protein